MMHKHLINANGNYAIKASDNTDHELCFNDGILSVMDDFGHCICEFDVCDLPNDTNVVKGHWEDVQETVMHVVTMKLPITHTAATCSVCKSRIGFVGPKKYLRDNICPNCGAIMELKDAVVE